VKNAREGLGREARELTKSLHVRRMISDHLPGVYVQWVAKLLGTVKKVRIFEVLA
jgi:hypothetical protein